MEGDRAAHETTWRALDERYDGTGPCGVLTFLDTPDPQAEWSDPRTLHAGYADDGRQARVAYFSAAVSRRIPGWPPAADAPFRVLPFASSGVTPDQVIAMWLHEAVVDDAEARRRVDEVQVVAVDAGGAPVGVASRFLAHDPQLRMDLFDVRVFVASTHRRSAAATALAVDARDLLQAAFVGGRDTRGAGIRMVIQNEHLRAFLPEPVWRQTQTVLIAEDGRGHHVRVFYFPGARAPLG